MNIGTQGLALFPNESAVRMNQLNERFSDKISNLPPTKSLSFIFIVSFQLFKSLNISIFNILYLKKYLNMN